jgi:hypothetical protein
VSLPPAFAAAAQRLVSGRWPGAAITRIELLKEWNRATVARCSLAGVGGDGTPASVIAKQAKDADESNERTFDDWASLEFLSRLPSLASSAHRPGSGSLAPAFLAGDRTNALFLMEDLGTGGTLEDVLAGDDPAAARAALLALAHTAGTLHASTAGHEAAYDRLRGALAPVAATSRDERAAEFDRGWETIQLAMDVASIPESLARAAREEHAAIVQALRAPDDLLTFTHGDVAPTNTYRGHDGWRLIDFEYGAYRHAFYDTIFWRVLCPLPPGLAGAMDAAHRAAFSAGCPSIQDDTAYRHARSAFALYGAWRTAVWHLRRALQRDSPFYGELTMRAALVFQLRNAATVARRDAQFPALAGMAERASAHLRDRWGAAAAHVPGWPAFARGAGHLASGTC